MARCPIAHAVQDTKEDGEVIPGYFTFWVCSLPEGHKGPHQNRPGMEDTHEW